MGPVNDFLFLAGTTSILVKQAVYCTELSNTNQELKVVKPFNYSITLTSMSGFCMILKESHKMCPKG